MAQQGLYLDSETLSCSICLDLLRDPVTTSCGHNYCFSCIRDHWDSEDERGIHSCPQCRKSFIPRPELMKNTILAALVEQLRTTGLQAAQCYAGAEDVACDVCTGRKLKAIKSCLVCLASYCENHLQPHHDAAPLRKHQLVVPSTNLRENICTRHDKMIEMFCRSDQQCICHSCCWDEHKGHNIVSAAEEREEKQRKLKESQQSIQQKILDREGELKELQQEVKDIKLSADKAVQQSNKIYSQLIHLMEKRSSEVEQHIRSQQEAEVRPLKELEEELEQELSGLRRKAAELQQLSLTEDHCCFLNHYSLPSLPAGSTCSSKLQAPRCCLEDIIEAVSESSKKIQQLLRNTWTNISTTNVEVSLPAEPRTRAQFLRYSCDITLDPNTAHRRLLLSEGNRRATGEKRGQPHNEGSDGFTYHCQVLSRKSLTGRCYWEVKIREGAVWVAAAYKSISRAGPRSLFGDHHKSWALRCYNQSYRFGSNGVWCEVSGPWSSTVGVYLDHAAGLLSFYCVSDSMTLLHRVQTSFTQPLHVGLGIYWDSSAELVKLG